IELTGRSDGTGQQLRRVTTGGNEIERDDRWMPMKLSICSGLRRRSLVRSTVVRSGLDRICMICADDSGGGSCPASVVCMPRRRTELVMIATKASFRVIFIGLFPHYFRSTDQYPAKTLGAGRALYHSTP